MKRILIIGSGDLGQQIAHYVSQSENYTIVGFVDDWVSVGECRRGFPIIGCVSQIEELYKENIFDELLIGIGYKHFDFRKSLFDKYKDIIPFATYIHPSCIVDKSAVIGRGSIILANCVISMDANIGDNVFMYSGSVTGMCSKINSNTFISASVSTGGFSIIGEQCFVGLGSRIIDNIVLGDKNLLGAGSVLIKSYKENNSVLAGCPARLIRKQ